MEEEIKLMIIILLGLCSLWKVRSMNRGTSGTREGVRAVEGRPAMQDEEKMEMRQEDTTPDIVKTEQFLFPPSPKRTIPNQTKTPYRKCLSGVTFEQDPTYPYTNPLPNDNPFFQQGRRTIRTNQQYLNSIQDLLLEPPRENMSYPSFTVPFLGEPPRQIVHMSAEEEEPSTPQQKGKKMKRKDIAKQHRFGRRQDKPKAHPLQGQLFSRLPMSRQKKEAGRKRSGVVDIDTEIKRRYEEIKVLERMKKRGMKE